MERGQKQSAHLTLGYRTLVGKADQGGEEKWLPLWMHLRDTAGIMKKLVAKWLPQSVIDASGLEYRQFRTVAVFLAAVHDIGKATSYFQSVITKRWPEKYGEVTSQGYLVNQKYRNQGKTPHAYAGQWILQNDTDGFGADRWLAAVVGAHHGNPDASCGSIETVDLLKTYPVNFFGVEKGDDVKSVWKDAWKETLNQALQLAGADSVEELPKLTLKAQVLLSGLLVMADWIASNQDFFPLLAGEKRGEEADYPARVEEGWDRLSFPACWNSEIHAMDKKLFRARFGFEPNEVQAALYKVVNGCENPGLFILEAQMGVGKTEAALAAAETLASRKKEGGIFFGLPTQTTSNGLFPRLFQWGESVSEETAMAISLAHGAAELNDDYQRLLAKGRAQIADGETQQEGLGVHPWFQGNKRALLSNFVIGTVDQFLMAALRRKHFMLRHIGLAGKVVIIDECHAYDAYMNAYLERGLQWLAAYGVPTVLLSATLPAQRRRALAECYAKAYARYYLKKKKLEITYGKAGWEQSLAYPLLTWTDGECIRQEKINQAWPEKTVKLQRLHSIEEMAKMLDRRLEDGGCACVIANTVKSAQEIYSLCKDTVKDVNLILYHAQFIMPDRIKKEKLLLEKMGKDSQDKDRRRLILIGSQVLEQSLDYDADIMVTQLCPVDLLLQRIGRLHRHARDGSKPEQSRPAGLREPECFILEDGEESYDSGSQAVYGDYLLMRTNHILPQEVNIPNSISELVQKVYGQEDTLEGENAGKKRGMPETAVDRITTEAHPLALGEAYQKFQKELKDKRQRAANYLMREPEESKGLEKLLVNEERSGEKMAEACVRDGASSLEVLLMRKGRNGSILFLEDNGTECEAQEQDGARRKDAGCDEEPYDKGWDTDRQGVMGQEPIEQDFIGQNRLSAQQPPGNKEGRRIAMQRIRLPHRLGNLWKIDNTVKELEERNRRELSVWQQSPWIRGELVLLLDEKGQAVLGDCLLSYSYEKGLECSPVCADREPE